MLNNFTPILAAFLFCLPVMGADPKPLTPQQAKLAKDSYEILRTYCGKCHGKGGSYSDEMLIDHKLLLEEGFVVPGKPEESPLVVEFQLPMALAPVKILNLE